MLFTRQQRDERLGGVLNPTTCFCSRMCRDKTLRTYTLDGCGWRRVNEDDAGGCARKGQEEGRSVSLAPSVDAVSRSPGIFVLNKLSDREVFSLSGCGVKVHVSRKRGQMHRFGLVTRGRGGGGVTVAV